MRIQCNSCSANLKPSPQYAGRKVKCPKCNTSLLIPPAVDIEEVATSCDNSVAMVATDCDNFAMVETQLSQMLKRANAQQLAGGLTETFKTQTPTVTALVSQPPIVKPIESQPPLVKALPSTSPPLVKPADDTDAVADNLKLKS